MTATYTVLADLLNKELTAVNELLGILQEEQSQLQNASIDLLQQLVPKKADIVTQLSQLSNNRYKQLAAEGFEHSEMGMKAWLEKTLQDEEAIPIQREWRELVSLTQTAKELNRINGLLISSQMTRNQQTLNVLRGNDNSSVYGPNGQRQNAMQKVRSVVSG